MPNRLRKILYVEDDDDIRTIATMALELVGKFEVRACKSGEEALAALEDFAADLILLDVMMPGMDGPTTLARLREQPRGARIPAIFMTAKVQPNEVDSLKGLGAIDVVTKPFDPMTLADTLRALWKSSRPEARQP
jgi:CheY-like chemotaxis protein